MIRIVFLNNPHIVSMIVTLYLCVEIDAQSSPHLAHLWPHTVDIYHTAKPPGNSLGLAWYFGTVHLWP